MAGPTLESLQGRIEQLEQQLANVAPQDTLNPNYLTIAADGTIGASFTGLIHALGLILPAYEAADDNPETRNLVEWESDDGASVAQLWAANYDNSPNIRELILTCLSGLGAGGNGNSSVTVQATSSDGSGSEASVGVSQFDNGSQPNAVRASVQDLNGNAYNVDVIDSNGGSSFIRASAGSGGHYVNAGNSAAVNFNGSLGQKAPIAHGLPNVPIAAFAQSDVAGAWCPVQLNTWDATNIYVSAGNGFTGVRFVSWLAIS